MRVTTIRRVHLDPVKDRDVIAEYEKDPDWERLESGMAVCVFKHADSQEFPAAHIMINHAEE